MRNRETEVKTYSVLVFVLTWIVLMVYANRLIGFLSQYHQVAYDFYYKLLYLYKTKNVFIFVVCLGLTIGLAWWIVSGPKKGEAEARQAEPDLVQTIQAELDYLKVLYEPKLEMEIVVLNFILAMGAVFVLFLERDMFWLCLVEGVFLLMTVGMVLVNRPRPRNLRPADLDPAGRIMDHISRLRSIDERRKARLDLDYRINQLEMESQKRLLLKKQGQVAFIVMVAVLMGFLNMVITEEAKSQFFSLNIFFLMGILMVAVILGLGLIMTWNMFFANFISYQDEKILYLYWRDYLDLGPVRSSQRRRKRPGTR